VEFLSRRRGGDAVRNTRSSPAPSAVVKKAPTM
jgi:hypothetical protein